jgi:hypothetical protein
VAERPRFAALKKARKRRPQASVNNALLDLMP